MKTVRRRRAEKKTDYKARFGLLKSGEIRLVVRKTNRYILAQFIETSHAQDKIIFGLTSKILIEKGWPKANMGSMKSLPAAYLTGFILGKLALQKNIKQAVLDIGMHRNIHKSRLYAVLKGTLDAGLKIPHNPEALPSDEDLQRNEKFRSILNKITKT